MWDTVWQVYMLLLRSWRWQISLDHKVPSLPDTLRVPIWFIAWLQNPLLWSCLVVDVFAPQTKFPWPIWLLYCDQLHFYLSHKRTVFGCFHNVVPQFELVKNEFLNLTTLHFICVVFKLHTGWSNAQCVSTLTTMILPITTGTFHALNCSGHVCLVGYVLWYINDCWLLYAKSCLYIYIEYMWYVNTFSW